MPTLVSLASIARLHIIAIGAMGTLTFGYALCGYRPWLLALLCASDWFVVNLLNRVVDLKEDTVNRIAGTQMVARHKRAVLIVGFAVLVTSLLATALWVPALLLFRLAFHTLGFAYNWRLLPWPGGAKRIKDLAFWKNTSSGAGFVLTGFCYPLAMLPRLPSVSWETVACAAVFFLLFELSYEVLYDLRDVDGDRLAGVRTWPVIFGARGGYWVAIGLLLASFVTIAGAYLAQAVPWRIAVMGAAPLLQLVTARYVVTRGITSRDCIMITWMGVALLGSWHLWEAFALPGSGP